MKVNLFNPVTKQAKQVKVGFSWTVLFFGFLPPLFRGDWKWAVIMLVAGMFSFGLSGLIFMFIYNKLYINDLISSGYKAGDEASQNMLLAKGFIVPTDTTTV